MGRRWLVPLLVVILIVVLVLTVTWWRWSSLTDWLRRQRQPFHDWLQELQDRYPTRELNTSEPTEDPLTPSLTPTPTLELDSTSQSLTSLPSRPPSINYRSEDYTSEPVQTRELIREFRTDPDNRHRYFYEEQCRQLFEELFPGYAFPKCRPSWLVNPRTGHPLELDGYNEDLRLAFEYNGPQHYHYPNRYHQSREAFLEQKFRDLVKYQLCNQRGVYLLTIPYHVPRHHLRSFIRRHLAYYRECVAR